MRVFYLLNYLGHNQIDEKLIITCQFSILAQKNQFLYLLSSIEPEQWNCVRFEIDVKNNIRMFF